jgi:hypothetical protein
MKSKEEHIIDHQKIFLAITIIIMIVVIIMSDTLSQAIIVISLISNLLVISAYMNLTHYRVKKYQEVHATPAEPSVETFVPSSDFEGGGRGVGPAAASSAGGRAAPASYKGAISPVEVGLGRTADEDIPHYDDMMYYGHTRRLTDEPLPWPNPYHQPDIEPTPGWTSSGEPGDEVVDVLDVNEKLANRGRTDYKGRADVGSLSRTSIVNKYFGEELDEQENRDWWGNFD